MGFWPISGELVALNLAACVAGQRVDEADPARSLVSGQAPAAVASGSRVDDDARVRQLVDLRGGEAPVEQGTAGMLPRLGRTRRLGRRCPPEAGRRGRLGDPV